jgi:hypothetical protein
MVAGGGARRRGGRRRRRRRATREQEEAVKHLLLNYEKAIETKDLPLFRSVKPNLSADEAKRLRKAFDSSKTHEVSISIEALECRDDHCLARRDVLDGSIVSSFPQSLRLAHGSAGLVIEIGR